MPTRLTRKEVLLQLGERVARQRQKRGLTLERLAYEMGMSKGNLSDVERGRRDPRFTTLRAVAIGLGIPLSHLLKDLDQG
jgi:XRE family transcriptional regulator, fatty acid utilization regulator